MDLRELGIRGRDHAKDQGFRNPSPAQCAWELIRLACRVAEFDSKPGPRGYPSASVMPAIVPNRREIRWNEIDWALSRGHEAMQRHELRPNPAVWAPTAWEVTTAEAVMEIWTPALTRDVAPRSDVVTVRKALTLFALDKPPRVIRTLLQVKPATLRDWKGKISAAVGAAIYEREGVR